MFVLRFFTGYVSYVRLCVVIDFNRVILTTGVTLSVTMFGRFGMSELYLDMSDIYLMIFLFDPSVCVGHRVDSLV